MVYGWVAGEMENTKDKPLYQKIIVELRSLIATGELKAGDRIPSESALAQQFGVSRITSKRALEEMEHEGLIYRVQGSGSYVKEQAAAPDRRAGSNTLALLLPFDSTKGRALDTIKGVNDCLHERGYLLTVHISDYDPEQEKEIIRRLVDSAVSGLIIYPYSDRQNIDIIFKLALQKYPVVTIDKYFERVAIPAVVTDNYSGAYAAAQHLIDKGHRRIGFSSARNVEESISARDRYFGFCQALSDNGIEPRDDYFVSVPEIRNSIDTTMFHGVLERLLDRQDPVTAVQALNDYEAISLLKATLEAGLKVPEQLSLVGFDNIELTEHVEVPLTTVEQDFYGIGCRAASLLLDQLQGRVLPAESRITVVPAKLIERASVADIRRRQ